MAATKKRTTKRSKSGKRRRISGRLSTKTLNDLIKRLKVTSKVSRKHRHHTKKAGSKKTQRATKKRSSKKSRKTTL